MSNDADDSSENAFEVMARKRALLLKEAAAVERDMAEYARIAAKYKLPLPELADTAAVSLATGIVPVANPAPPVLDKNTPITVEDLIHLYKRRPDSPYQKLTHASRKHYDALLSMIMRDHGDERLADIQQAHFMEWHMDWSKGGTLSIAHAKIGMVRNIFGFGTEVLQDSSCGRLFGILCKLKYKAPAARTERLTERQANDIRAMARDMGRPSIALAQAFQSGTGLLQKDIVGEWVPVAEPGMSDITSGPLKWLRGLRWNEIDDELVLRHSSLSWMGDVEIPLAPIPMVMDEFRIRFGFDPGKHDRTRLPASGPVIISEWDNLPWTPVEFRRWWRKIATACGVPTTVKNMDSRPRAKDGDNSDKKERRHAK